MTEHNHRNHSEQNSPTLSELVKKEQDYRHKWQDKFLCSYTTNFRLGQALGFIYNIALLYLVNELVNSGEQKLAAIIFCGNILLIAFGLLVTKVERKTLNKKPMRKNHNDRRFRNFKKRER